MGLGMVPSPISLKIPLTIDETMVECLRIKRLHGEMAATSDSKSDAFKKSIPVRVRVKALIQRNKTKHR